MGDPLFSLRFRNHIPFIIHREPVSLFHVGFIIVEIGMVAGWQRSPDNMSPDITLFRNFPESTFSRGLTFLNMPLGNIPPAIAFNEQEPAGGMAHQAAGSLYYNKPSAEDFPQIVNIR